jgi:hypothetical protein
LVFERGHLLEAVVRAQLEMIGFAFAPSETLEFKALDGILGGHADGVAIAGPRLPGFYLAFPLVWENKAVNAKNFRAVQQARTVHGLSAVCRASLPLPALPEQTEQRARHYRQ